MTLADVLDWMPKALIGIFGGVLGKGGWDLALEMWKSRHASKDREDQNKVTINQHADDLFLRMKEAVNAETEALKRDCANLRVELDKSREEERDAWDRVRPLEVHSRRLTEAMEIFTAMAVAIFYNEPRAPSDRQAMSFLRRSASDKTILPDPPTDMEVILKGVDQAINRPRA